MKFLRLLLLAGMVFCLVVPALMAETVMDHGTSSSSNGNSKNTSGLSMGKGSSLFSLFDPSKFHMSHTYSMSFISSGGQSQSIAAYINQIDYQFAKPLRMQVNLAFIHQPQTWFGANASSSLNNRILPSFSLIWEPSRNLHVSLNYEQWVPGVYNSSYPNYYRSPYGRYGSPFDR